MVCLSFKLGFVLYAVRGGGGATQVRHLALSNATSSHLKCLSVYDASSQNWFISWTELDGSYSEVPNRGGWG